MKTNTHRSRIAWLMFCLIISLGSSILWRPTPVLAQTPVKSSREERLRRIEEHRQIRQRTLELAQDLRGLHLTPPQRSEIREVLRRYNMSTGINRQEPNNGGPTESGIEDSGSIATQPPAAERMRAEVLQLLTSEQSDKLNAIKQEREERALKAPDFKVVKKP